MQDDPAGVILFLIVIALFGVAVWACIVTLSGIALFLSLAAIAVIVGIMIFDLR